LEINNQPSKEKEKANKTPLKNKMNSVKMTNLKKKKLFETGILSKISIRKMEKDIRNQIILSSKQIQLDLISDDFNEEDRSKTLTNNIRSKILEKADTEKSNKIWNDEGKTSLKNSNNNNDNQNYYKKLSSKSIINSNSLGKLNTDPMNNPKNNMLRISSKSILNLSRGLTGDQINEQNYRKIVRTKILYDSLEDNESDNENERQGFFCLLMECSFKHLIF
jgi:hypothetical protein